MDTLLLKLRGLGHLLGSDSIEMEKWDGWLVALQAAFAQPPPMTLVLSNPERKWELVSAYQKTCRQGNYELASRLVSAMASMESERAYMWKRINTTAAEDIGHGGILEMKFVLACNTVFSSAKLPNSVIFPLWLFLTDILCSSVKSRLYCQFSILRDALVSPDLKYKSFDSCTFGEKIREVLLTDLKALDLSESEQWLLKSNWRAEGMAIGPIQQRLLNLPVTPTDEVPIPSVLLKGLPGYCYDMHTRVGKGALTRACGVLQIRQFFATSCPRSKPEALGWALFLEEGGKIRGRLANQSLDDFEQVVIAERHGLSVSAWSTLRSIVRELLLDGTFDSIRSSILDVQRY